MFFEKKKKWINSSFWKLKVEKSKTVFN